MDCAAFPWKKSGVSVLLRVGHFEVTFSLAALSFNSRCSESVGSFPVRGISPRIQAGRGLARLGYEWILLRRSRASGSGVPFRISNSFGSDLCKHLWPTSIFCVCPLHEPFLSATFCRDVDSDQSCFYLSN